MNLKDLLIYLSPSLSSKKEYSKGEIGNSVTFLNEETSLNSGTVAIIGVSEERGTNAHHGTGDGPEKIREQLYQLTDHFRAMNVVDMGNIIAGAQLKDTYFAIQEVVKYLAQRDVITVVLGGSQDITYGVYKAYEFLEKVVNLLTVDPSIDIGVLGAEINDTNYINHIITHQPNYLFNYSNIGFQSYFVTPEVWDLMNEMDFDATRLGVIRENIALSEPLLRDADMVSVDVSCVRNSDLPGCKIPSPNGFYGEEICQMARYAGVSDKLSSFGLYNYNPTYDNNNVGAMLCAQIVWYFIDGVKAREGDYPVASKEKYLKYIVPSSNTEEDMIFYKSQNSERWWMEIPHPENVFQKYKRHHMIPCAYQDYLNATEGDVPERWWQAYNKLMH